MENKLNLNIDQAIARKGSAMNLLMTPRDKNGKAQAKTQRESILTECFVDI